MKMYGLGFIVDCDVSECSYHHHSQPPQSMFCLYIIQTVPWDKMGENSSREKAPGSVLESETMGCSFRFLFRHLL